MFEQIIQYEYFRFPHLLDVFGKRVRYDPERISIFSDVVNKKCSIARKYMKKNARGSLIQINRHEQLNRFWNTRRTKHV